MKLFSYLFPAIAVVTLSSSIAYCTTLNLGYVAFDITNPPLAEVDIVNLTGPNALPPSFPVTTSVSLSNLDLTVDFASGSPETFGPASGYFTLQSDGLSFDGQDIFNTTTNPVTKVTLTGDLAPSTVVSGGTTYSLSPASFSISITDTSGMLADGDFAVLTASGTPTTVSGVPEPQSQSLIIGGLLVLLALAISRRRLLAGRIFRRLGLLSLISSLALFGSTTASITLNSLTSPSTGVSGTTNVWITGSGFPSGSFVSTTVSLATTCAATGTTTAAIAEKDIVGNVARIEFLVPSSLSTGLYYASVSGSTTGGAFSSGTSCSKIQVTHTSAVLASCNPGSSMGILSYNPTGAATTPVTAYVPNGDWGGGSTGVQVVPLEGGGSPSSVSTTYDVNSCSSNSITGETVCIDNYTDIYLVNGSTLKTTLTSGATAYTGFSGGDCENCTVAVNEAAGTKGQAVIGVGYGSATGDSALQFLDMASNTLGTPVPMNERTSEDILWDPFRNLVVSPNEQGYYELFKVTGSGIPGPTTVTELSYYGGETFDSAAEDCTTQIGLASVEAYPTGLYITDLSQVKTGSGGTYTAPGQFLSIAEFGEFSAATDGIAVAPGSTHLGVITGEFGGNQFAALSLPATSGSGTPTLVDYVAAVLPATPDGCTFGAGYDPHTTTAYTSPNNGKAYGVLADWYPGSPDYVAVVDLAALLKAPRKSGIYPDGSPCPVCVNVVNPSYDLVANGVVTYVGTGNKNCIGVASGVAEGVRTNGIKAGAAKGPVNKMPPKP